MRDLPIIESVPNFSEGSNRAIIEALADCFRQSDLVKLLDYSSDPDHNRSVFTIVGSPEQVCIALQKAIAVAVKEIDMRQHTGVHPCIGSADVVPLIPVQGLSIEEAKTHAIHLAECITKDLKLPVYLYADSASIPERKYLPIIRKGGFTGLSAQMQNLSPDFGPSLPHPTAGATVIGVRGFLVAYNINLASDNLEIAKQIANKIGTSNGGLPYLQALGLPLAKRGIVQVSMNLLNPEVTTVEQVYATVAELARKLEVKIHSTEQIGLRPEQVRASL